MSLCECDAPQQSFVIVLHSWHAGPTFATPHAELC